MRQPEKLAPLDRAKRSIYLVFLTLFFPGSAQYVAGNKMIGRLCLRLALLTLIGGLVAIAIFFVKKPWVLAAVTRTWPLLFILIAVFTAAIAWAALFFDSFFLGVRGRPPLWSKLLTGLLTITLVVATSGPLVYFGQFIGTYRGALGTVFAGKKMAKPTQGRYNVLLIGGDAGAGRASLRNDTNILFSVDAATGKAVQVGIPRNLVDAPFPQDSPLAKKFPKGFRYSSKDHMINAVYRYGIEHPQHYPDAKDSGAEAVMDAITGVTGLEVHYYVLINMQGFETLVDALGGIEMDVRKRVPKATTDDKVATEFIEVGRQHLNGKDALWFARSRFDTTDYERMTRQRCVVSAITQQLAPTTILTRYADIARSSPDVVQTDIPQEKLATLGDIAMSMRGQPIESVALVPPEINTSKPDYLKIRKMVRDALERSKNAPAPEAAADNNSPTQAPAAPSGEAQPAPKDQASPEAICVP